MARDMDMAAETVQDVSCAGERCLRHEPIFLRNPLFLADPEAGEVLSHLS